MDEEDEDEEDDSYEEYDSDEEYDSYEEYDSDEEAWESAARSAARRLRRIFECRDEADGEEAGVQQQQLARPAGGR